MIAASSTFPSTGEAGASSQWWWGPVLAIVLWPAVWIVGLAIPRLSLNFASGCMIGGAIGTAVSVLGTAWSFVPGGLLVALSGLAVTKGQYLRLGE